MTKNFLWLNPFLFSLFIFVSCGKPAPAIEGFVSDDWKQDMYACQGIRTSMADTLTRQKNKLLGLNEMEVLNLLGKPDENELYQRNQKFYHYYLQPSGTCLQGIAKNNVPKKISLRFNAVGLVKEITIE